MKTLRLLILASPFMLAACGDGWEMVRTDAFPYGNQRTAGTGVAYVLAKMMPEKELVITPMQTPEPAPTMEQVFDEKQRK